MAILINNSGLQHYANQMVKGENRKVNGQPLPSVLTDIDTKLDEMKTIFDEEYGSALDMKLENNENVFSVGSGSGVDKRSEVENSFTDVEVFGNSIVNLWAKRDGSANLTNVSTNTNNEYVGSINAGSDCGFISHMENINSGTYTVVFQLKTESTLAKPKIMFFDLGAFANPQSTTLSTPPSNTGWNTYVLTRDVTKTNGSTVLVGANCPASEVGMSLSVRNVMVLEGDYTNKPLPTYFEGLKSVGEKEDRNEIEVLSVGKNLCDNGYNYCNWVKGYNNSNPDYERFEDGYILHYTNSRMSTNKKFLTHLVHGKEYTVSFDVELLTQMEKTLQVYLTGTKGNLYGATRSTSGKLRWTFTYDKGYQTVGVYFQSNDSYTPMAKITNIQLEETTTQPLYEPYKEDKKQISLSEPLRGLPNGVKDSIEKINGEWKIIRRCSEIILNGTETWGNIGNGGLVDSSNKMFTLSRNLGSADNTSINIISDKVAGYNANYTWANDVECISLNINGNVQMRINPSKLTEVSFDALKNWLTTNPIKCVYRLPTPIIEDIDEVTLQAFKNGTISINEALPVSTTHTVALNKPAQIKRNIEELTQLRDRVQALEEMYDALALEQAHQLDLLAHSFELDYEI